MAYRTTPIDTDKMPPGIPYIIGNEAAERFSFYGMRAILTVFMTSHLFAADGTADFMSAAEASKIQHWFLAAAYFTPLLGAFLADGLFGKYPVIIALSLFYCLGHGVLALMDVPEMVGLEPRYLLYIGLTLIAIGAGGVKPCVSSHVGDQFGRRNANLLEKVYGWFYISINVGAAISQLLTPWVLAKYGAGWAFGIPGVLMAIATFIFWLGRKEFAHVPPSKEAFGKELKDPENRRIILRLVPLYIFIVAFWMIFDQTSTRWVVQAKDLDREVSFITAENEVTAEYPAPEGANVQTRDDGSQFYVGPLQVLPSQLQAVNPIYILVFVPFMSVVLFPFLSRFMKVTPLRKIGFGLALTGVAFAVTGLAQQAIDSGGKPHITWQIVAYAVLTFAEVLVSVTSLEFSYTQAPKSWKSLIMGIYFLSVGSANLLVAQVNHYIEAKREAGEQVLAGADYYWFFAGVMAAAAVAFVLWSLTYKYREGLDGMGPGEAGRAVPLDSGRDGMAAPDEG